MLPCLGGWPSADTDDEFYPNLNLVIPLSAIIEEYAGELSTADQAFCKELVLWALTIKNKLDKSENDTSYKFDAIGLGREFYRNN
jgi:magnesium chelatase subunit I